MDEFAFQPGLLDLELASLVTYFVFYFEFYCEDDFVVYFGWYELVVLETVVLRSFLTFQLVGEVSRVLLFIVAIQLQIKTASLFSYKSSGFNQFLRGS